MDGWSPAELRRLPEAWVCRLTEFYNRWEEEAEKEEEEEGHWPASVERSIIAFIP